MRWDNYTQMLLLHFPSLLICTCSHHVTRFSFIVFLLLFFVKREKKFFNLFRRWWRPLALLGSFSPSEKNSFMHTRVINICWLIFSHERNSRIIWNFHKAKRFVPTTPLQENMYHEQCEKYFLLRVSKKIVGTQFLHFAEFMCIFLWCLFMENNCKWQSSSEKQRSGVTWVKNFG